MSPNPMKFLVRYPPWPLKKGQIKIVVVRESKKVIQLVLQSPPIFYLTSFKRLGQKYIQNFHCTDVEEVLIIQKKIVNFFGPRMFIRS